MALRIAFLRLCGARIARRVSLFRGVQVLEPARLSIGTGSVIGWRCVLDARGSITIGKNVVIASDSQFVTAWHALDSPKFEAHLAGIQISDFAWIASRAFVSAGVHIQRGGVLVAHGVAARDIPEFEVHGGVPARKISERVRDLNYDPYYHPPLY